MTTKTTQYVVVQVRQYYGPRDEYKIVSEGYESLAEATEGKRAHDAQDVDGKTGLLVLSHGESSRHYRVGTIECEVNEPQDEIDARERGEIVAVNEDATGYAVKLID